MGPYRSIAACGSATILQMEERWVWVPTPEARAQAEAFPGAPGQRRAVLQEVVHSKCLPHRTIRCLGLRLFGRRLSGSLARSPTSTPGRPSAIHLALFRLWHSHTLGSWHDALQALSGTPAGRRCGGISDGRVETTGRAARPVVFGGRPAIDSAALHGTAQHQQVPERRLRAPLGQLLAQLTSPGAGIERYSFSTLNVP